jgi:hypothetical protein
MTALSMTRGDRQSFTVTLTDGAGAPLNLTDLTVTFTAKRTRYDSDAAAVIQKSDGDGIVITTPASGVAVLTIEPEDTEELTNLRTLHWDIQVDDGSGDVRTPITGRLVILPDITRTRI